ncbi:MAG: DUF6427 family protein [Bacteroidia bacterium]
MLIRYFKSNSASALVILPIIALIIWAFGFSFPAPLPLKHSMPLYELICGPIAGIHWLAILTGVVLVVSEAFLLNYIVNENEVLTKQTWLPALFYILFMSNNPDMLLPHPMLFSNLFVLFALNKLLSSYRKDNAYSQSFDAGMLISVATLFYYPCIVFFPMLAAGFIIMRSFNWREWLIAALGAIVPYFFVLTMYFWNGTLDYLLYDKIFFQFLREKPHLTFPKSFYFMLSIGWAIILFSLFTLVQGVGIGTQRSKKSIVLLMWFFFFSALSVFIAPEVSTPYFSGLVIPTAVFCANYFAHLRRSWWAETLFLLMLVSLFVNLLT